MLGEFPRSAIIRDRLCGGFVITDNALVRWIEANGASQLEREEAELDRDVDSDVIVWITAWFAARFDTIQPLTLLAWRGR